MRPRWVRLPHAPATCLLLLASAPIVSSVAAQDTIPPVAAPPPRTDTAEPGKLRPLPAFFHSLAIPGWGQSKLDRKLTAALFVAWEGVTLGMALKASGEVRYLERAGADSARLADKRQERQDWLILLAFNHLFSGLEAFVSSQLQDFPADVRFRAAPRGIGLQASLPVRIR